MSAPTILVIDDDETLHDIIAGALSRINVTVLFSNNGEDGYQQAHAHLPQLILMDLRLPNGVKGWEIIESLKSEPDTSHIPIVAFSASGGEYIRKAMECGADGFINKPFTFKELQRVVMQYAGMIEQ